MKTPLLFPGGVFYCNNNSDFCGELLGNVRWNPLFIRDCERVNMVQIPFSAPRKKEGLCAFLFLCVKIKVCLKSCGIKGSREE